MKNQADIKKSKPPIVKSLTLAIAANTLLVAGYSHAGPTGGVVVDGGGSITQSGTNTRIDQNTDRLSLQWDTFNVANDERVQFVQPNSSSMALNRILDNNGSRILGQIDANGHVVLMNPNGIFFGQGATVNVGGLVASGLNINSDDFMNGDLAFAGTAGTAGTVVNRGIINAATGGNVALIGKTVANHGLISANLGHIALASGSEAVVTFDDQGLIGVRIDKETLASEVGTANAAYNTGTLEAKGGKILLNASVSADLFSQAVNHGEMGGTTTAVVHDDGSFTLGAGHSVVNTGTVNVSTDSGSTDDAGYVVLAGNTVDHRGTIRANAEGSNRAGQVYAEAYDQVSLGAYSNIEATNTGVTSGKVSLDAERIDAAAGAKVVTSGDTLVAAELMIKTPQINTNHLYVQSIGDVSQNGTLTATGNTHLNILSEANVAFTNASNDFNTFSLDSGYTTNTQIVDRNDIQLGNLNISDSTLSVQALGSGAGISQLAGSRILVDSSELNLAADNVVVGENSEIDMYMGTIGIKFAQHVNTNSAITLGGESGIYPNFVRIEGAGDYYGGVTLTGNRAAAVDLKATIDDGAESLVIENMVGDNASLEGLYETTQTGPITLTNALTWNSYKATLEHAENDVAALQGTGAIAFGHLRYADKNDVLVRNMDTVTENSVSITSLGSGSAIKQEANTSLKADFIALKADNIHLGANGRSRVDAGYVLEIDFGRQLDVNGPYSVGSYAPYLRITGNDSNNRMVFGQYATSSSFASDDLLASIDINLGAGNDTAVFNSEFLVGNTEYWNVNKLDMGSGNDRVYFNKSVHIPLTLGAGKDLLRVWDTSTYYDVQDLDTSEDRFTVYRQ